ncbi:hypothetical protein [Argonema antarcticum]|uniref:hypothetical protein n=1 Tax=Argonema antarcticum TaxID=2942763 RepID=UPI002011F4FA|nr:hypothetical protein [Argonema antarcticum]MCL1473130.1 hypothetical protein [Argonema antarcticum A004/B2]
MRFRNIPIVCAGTVAILAAGGYWYVFITGWNYWHKHLTDALSYVGEQCELPTLNRSDYSVGF